MLDLFIPIGLQVLLPIGFLVWQWRKREHSWLEWWLKTILIGSYLLGITLVTLWLLLPWYLAYVYLGLFGLATILSFRHTKNIERRWHQSWKNWWWVVSCAIAIAFCTHILIGAGLANRLPVESPIKPSFPLRKGSYYIANGGNHTLLNAHLAFLNHPKYRGSSYAVDILKLNEFG